MKRSWLIAGILGALLVLALTMPARPIGAGFGGPGISSTRVPFADSTAKTGLTVPDSSIDYTKIKRGGIYRVNLADNIVDALMFGEPLGAGSDSVWLKAKFRWWPSFKITPDIFSGSWAAWQTDSSHCGPAVLEGVGGYITGPQLTVFSTNGSVPSSPIDIGVPGIRAETNHTAGRAVFARVGSTAGDSAWAIYARNDRTTSGTYGALYGKAAGSYGYGLYTVGKNYLGGATTVSGGLTATLTGNVTGNVTGNLTGNVTGNLTGTASHATNADTATVLAAPPDSAVNAAWAWLAGIATHATESDHAASAAALDSLLDWDQASDAFKDSVSARAGIPDQSIGSDQLAPRLVLVGPTDFNNGGWFTGNGYTVTFGDSGVVDFGDATVYLPTGSVGWDQIKSTVQDSLEYWLFGILPDSIATAGWATMAGLATHATEADHATAADSTLLATSALYANEAGSLVNGLTWGMVNQEVVDSLLIILLGEVPAFPDSVARAGSAGYTDTAQDAGHATKADSATVVNSGFKPLHADTADVALIAKALTASSLLYSNFTAALLESLAVHLTPAKADSAGKVAATFKPTTAGTADSAKTITDGAVDTNALGASAVSAAKLDEPERAALGLAPAGDTLFVRWVYASPDTYLCVVRVDENGDTLQYSQSWRRDGNAKKFNSLGLQGGGPDSVTFLFPATAPLIFPHWRPETGWGAYNFHNDGMGSVSLDNYVLTWLVNNGRAIHYREAWDWKGNPATGDTAKVAIIRDTAWRLEDAYVTLRYQIKSNDTVRGGDTLRIICGIEAKVGDMNVLGDGGTNSSNFDVAYYPGYGYRYRRQVWSREDLTCVAGGPVFGVADIGNPLVPSDTLSTGASGVWATALKTSCGGPADWIASFVAFNPNADIVPSYFSQQDTVSLAGEFIPFATDIPVVDTTAAWHESGHSRFVICRSDTVKLNTTTYQTFEIALGRARIPATGEMPVLPIVKFQDGAILRPTDARTR
jgi:hypothetical protein